MFLKSHFCDAQKELKEIRGPTMQQAGFHHANMFASQLRVYLRNQQAEMLAMVQTLVKDSQVETGLRIGCAHQTTCSKCNKYYCARTDDADTSKI